LRPGAFGSFCQNKKKAPGRAWQRVLFHCPHGHRTNQTYIAAKHPKHFCVKDNLGSTRAVVDEAGVVVEAYDYYPFGLQSRSYKEKGDSLTKETFTGKEQDIESNMHYFGARYYDAGAGRWLSVDPLAYKYRSYSPYNYALNNPHRFVDPNGKDLWERLHNWWYKDEWRDDTLEENFEQEDWKNATPQLGDAIGLDNDRIELVYADYGPLSQPIHVTSPLGEDKAKITMTRAGYEQIDEKNIENVKNSLVHEKKHAEDILNQVDKGEPMLPKDVAEARAINEQQTHKTWEGTTETYKANIGRRKKKTELSEKERKKRMEKTAESRKIVNKGLEKYDAENQ
jgi:RHS repeat-associated protein